MSKRVGSTPAAAGPWVLGATAGLALALSVACSGEKNGSPDGGVADGGPVVDGGEAGTDAPRPTGKRSGYVEVGLLPGITPASYADALFDDGTLVEACPRIREAGTCWVYDCNAGPPPLEDPPTPLSAGDITISGASFVSPLILKHGLNGYTTVGGGAAFKPGETLRAAALGEVVPAFTLEGKAPEPAVLTSPVCTNTQCGDLDRSSDLSLAWTGGGEGVAIDLRTTDPTGTLAKAVGIRCAFDGPSRSAKVPKDLLAKLFSGTRAFFTLVPRSEVSMEIQGWSLKFRVTNLGPSDLSFRILI